MNPSNLAHVDRLIDGLHELTYNLWWTWNPKAQDIYQLLSERKWRGSNHSAVAVMKSVSRQELRARLWDKEFREKVEDVLNDCHS